MNRITTPALALSVLMAVSPLAALAHEGPDDAAVQVSAEVHVENSNRDSGSENKGPGDKVREGLRGLFTGPLLKMRGSENANEHRSSTSMEHMGTTSPKHPEGMDDRGGLKGDLKARVGVKSDAGIDARIAKLNDTLVRLGSVQRLSADMKASLTTAINAQIDALKALKLEVQANASSTVKDDMNATKDSFRAYSLLLPKAAITAAGDRIMTIVGQMEALSVKIDARIDAASTAGTDVTAARAALTDFTAKVADAKVQAQSAVSLVANLTITKDDDQATVTANAATLKSAKAKIDAAQADLKAARADIASILKSIKGKGEVEAGASVKASAQ